MLRLLLKLQYVLNAPFSILAITTSDSIHPAYRMSLPRRLALGMRMLFNITRVRTGTSYKAHLAMAVKLFEMPPETAGSVIECGTWKGGSAVNLSLVCRIVGRKLRIFDSFEGLPEARPGDREAPHYQPGDYRGTLDEVKRNIARYGAIEVCEFVPGWFDQTLPALEGPVVLAFVDVDFEASLHTCVKCIWPHLTEHGYLFTDEAVGTDYCALFYSERWWSRHFGRMPPGLIGAGSGIPLGDHYLGPVAKLAKYPLNLPQAVGYTQKSMSGAWTYEPGDSAPA